MSMHIGHSEDPGQRVHPHVEDLVGSLCTVHVTEQPRAAFEHCHHLDVSGKGEEGREGGGGEGRGRRGGKGREGEGRGV